MYEVDWVATGAMLQGVGTVVGAGAVFVSAKLGVRTWKDQKRAERRLEIAERVLTATHKAREALAYVRNPLVWGGELAAAEEKLKQDQHWGANLPDRQKRMITAQAHLDRLSKTRDEQTELQECLPMARSLFGIELENAVRKLIKQFWIVRVDAESYVDDEPNHDPEFSKKIRRGMYSVPAREGERNEVSDAIDEAVSLIERVCEPALRLEDLD